MSNITSSFPAPIYRDQVLAHIFADAQHLFLPSLLEIDRAHAVMLYRSGIITRETASACLQGIDALKLEELRSAIYDGSVEDLFFLIEKKLADVAGEEHAGRLHTARSRNDIDLTMYRMVLRSNLLGILNASVELRSVLLSIATQYRDSLMPAYTHNQPAQPTTIGHYMMAMIEILERDAERLIACFARVNRNPLGACAITTTGFPIQRDVTMRLLGFNGLVVNSYGAIAAVDYVAEACSVLATAMLSLGRFAQDMLLWSTAEFNFLRLSNGYVQISSIMPQKRNPVPLEHTRILASRALTESQAVLGSLHNTPFADMNDGEDPLQPLVALAFSDAQRALTLIAGALSEATFNTEHMQQRANSSFLPVTEVADTLVRQTGISFHDAHTIVSAAVKSAASDDVAAFVDDLFQRTQKTGVNITKEQLQQAMNPEYFVAIRTVTGGPATSAMQPQIDRASQQLQLDQQWLDSTRTNLEEAKTLLHRECESIIQHHP